MVQYIKQGNVFGRLGAGIGKGLSEQVPKEIERARLSSGLRELGQKQGLTPFQQFAELSGLPGVTPQMIQSGAELLRQQGQNVGLRNYKNEPGQQDQSPANILRNAISKKTVPSDGGGIGLKKEPTGIVSEEGTQAALRNYIPRTRDQKLARAAELQEQNPALYPTVEAAMQAEDQEDQRNLAISQAEQGNRKSQFDVLNTLRGELQKAKTAANVEIPENVYQQVENDVLDKVNRGLIKEDRAVKEAQKELDKISRQYNALKAVGRVGYIFRDTNSIKRNLREIREDFKERDDLENLADMYITANGLSPGKAYYLAFPPSETKELNNILAKLPEIKPRTTVERGFGERTVDPVSSRKKTLEIAPELAKALGKDGSPLAVGEILNSLGYDRSAWLEYLGSNRKKLDLSERQGRELGKPNNFFPSMNDNYLFWSSGLEKLVEK